MSRNFCAVHTFYSGFCVGRKPQTIRWSQSVDVFVCGNQVFKEFKMAISSVGIGSGLDVESIVTQMVELERRPIKTLEAKAEFIDAKISVQGQIKSMVSDLHAALFDLTLEGTWKTAKATTSGSSVSASISGPAAAGNYNIEVTSLAQSQTVVSSSWALKTSWALASWYSALATLRPSRRRPLSWMALKHWSRRRKRSMTPMWAYRPV